MAIILSAHSILCYVSCFSILHFSQGFQMKAVMARYRPSEATSRLGSWSAFRQVDDSRAGDYSSSSSPAQLAATIFAEFVLTLPLAAAAVSGGGLDYANLDITGQDFSNGNYKGKDFTQVIAKGTTFAKSNLQGCRFYKAYLAKADFSGSDLRGASLEDTSMDDAIMKNAIASGAYFGASILDVGSVENADFTDAQLPPKILTQLCARDDVKGSNPATGADTRESLMCP